MLITDTGVWNLLLTRQLSRNEPICSLLSTLTSPRTHQTIANDYYHLKYTSFHNRIYMCRVDLYAAIYDHLTHVLAHTHTSQIYDDGLNDGKAN